MPDLKISELDLAAPLELADQIAVERGGTTNHRAPITDLASLIATTLAQTVTFNGRIDEVGGILKGQAIYVKGATGSAMTISIADNADFSKTDTIGIAFEGGLNNATIQFITDGLLENIDTSSFTTGDKLYLGTAGGIVNVHPSGTDSVVAVGYAVKINASTGSMFVTITSSTDVHDVDGTARVSVVNLNAGINAVSSHTMINDLGHRCSISMAGSNNTLGEDASFFSDGYGEMNFINNGNKSFVWFTDPTDSHNPVNLVQKMTLSADGDLTPFGDFTLTKNGGIITIQDEILGVDKFGTIQMTGSSLVLDGEISVTLGVGGSGVMSMTSSLFSPTTTGAVDLGSSSFAWGDIHGADVFAEDGTFSGGEVSIPVDNGRFYLERTAGPGSGSAEMKLSNTSDLFLTNISNFGGASTFIQTRNGTHSWEFDSEGDSVFPGDITVLGGQVVLGVTDSQIGLLTLRGPGTGVEGAQIDMNGALGRPDYSLDTRNDDFRLFTDFATDTRFSMFNLGAGAFNIETDGDITCVDVFAEDGTFTGDLAIGSTIPTSINSQANDLVISTATHVGATLATTNSAATLSVFFAEGADSHIAGMRMHGSTHASAGQFKIQTSVSNGLIELRTANETLAVTVDAVQSMKLEHDLYLTASGFIGMTRDNINGIHGTLTAGGSDKRSGISFTTGNEVKFFAGNNVASVFIGAVDIRPDVDLVHDLGTSSKSFKDLYIDDVIASGDITADGIIVAGGNVTDTTMTNYNLISSKSGVSGRAYLRDLSSGFTTGNSAKDGTAFISDNGIFKILGSKSDGTATTAAFIEIDQVNNITTISGELKAEGAMFHNNTTVVSNYTVVASDYLITVSGVTTVTITLPAAASNTDRILKIINIHATNNVTVDGNGAELINGATTQALNTQYATITIHSNGTQWYII